MERACGFKLSQSPFWCRLLGGGERSALQQRYADPDAKRVPSRDGRALALPPVCHEAPAVVGAVVVVVVMIVVVVTGGVVVGGGEGEADSERAYDEGGVGKVYSVLL